MIAGAGVSGHDSARTLERLRSQACLPGRALFGRDAELCKVAEMLQTHRFVTIVGPGGMGKTTLARAVVTQCAELYPDGVRFLDLAALGEGRDVVGALGAALGITRLTLDGPAQLAACLRGQRMLIVFDCCEHHTSMAARASEALLRAAPGIDVLCTGREPLLAHGERIVRLGPVGVPGAADAPDAASAGRIPAVALFVARANGHSLAGFVLDQGNVALVCDICRSVEGLPLALELAAALVQPLGLLTLAQQTARSLLQSSAGLTHVSERHRTLSNMLDWSYDALSAREQAILRSLAIFRGNFTLEAAGAVAAASLGPSDSVIDTVIELAAKSLVSMDSDGRSYCPRLLDVTRQYAFDKLRACGELAAVQGRHARWLATLMDRLEQDWMALPRADWLALYSPWVNDVLAAIDWALGPGQDPMLGAHLAGIGFSLGDQIGLAREFQEYVQRAAGAIDDPVDPPPQVIALLLRLGAVNTDGRDLFAHSYHGQMQAAERNVALARLTGSSMLQGPPLTAMWGWPYVRGNYPVSLAGAEQIVRSAEASADPYLAVIGQRTLAQSLHGMGRHTEAKRCAHAALASPHQRIPLPYQPSPVQVATSMRIVLARVLWMEGAADQAVAMAAEAVASSEGDRPVALCQALCLAAIPVALWRGDSARAAQMLELVRERAEGHGLGFWLDWAQRFGAALAVMDGTEDAARWLAGANQHEFSAKCRDHLVTFAPALLTEDAIARCDSGMVGWCAPELLRARALQSLGADPLDRAGQAVAWLGQSVALAQAQGAPAWALRSATSLAALYERQDARQLARATLAPFLARCTEGQDTADVRAALALRAALGSGH